LGLLAPLAVAQNTGCRVDQVGYLTGEQKDFRVATSARGFEIIGSDGQVALSGTLPGPILDPFAGENVWLGQFAKLRTPGKYTVRLADGTMSWPFAIGDAVYRAAVLGLYADRCVGGCLERISCPVKYFHPSDYQEFEIRN